MLAIAIKLKITFSSPCSRERPAREHKEIQIQLERSRAGRSR